MWISWKPYCTPGFLQPPDLCLDFWEGSPTAAPLHSRDARCTRPTDVAAEKKDCCKRGCPWARQRLGFLQILYMFWTDVQVLHRFRCVSRSWSMRIYGVSDGVIVKLETIEAFSFWGMPVDSYPASPPLLEMLGDGGWSEDSERFIDVYCTMVKNYPVIPGVR